MALLPADRVTRWDPGVPGGIPARAKICASVDAAKLSGRDASSAIQQAIDGCRLDQVVQLSAGTFRVNGAPILLSRGMTLRGAGAGRTILDRTNGSQPNTYVPKRADPVIVVGAVRWPKIDETTATLLARDGEKGAMEITLASPRHLVPGEIVRLDEDGYATAAWMPLPNRKGRPAGARIWASDRVVWQRHDPKDPVDDPFPQALTWFMRSGRPISELKEVAAVKGNVVIFTTPLHIGYRASHKAQLTRFEQPQTRRAGIEALTVRGGGDGNVRFENAAECWMKDVEDTAWLGEGVAIDASFRIEVRGSFVHDGVWPEPGGGGYAISLSTGSSEVLIEDNIVVQANKVMVARAAGAGSVVGYNYMDDGHMLTAPKWQEVGLNASHMAGSHHVLFEGNESFNYDSDCTHGNAIDHTVFRNHLTGYRRHFPEDPKAGNVRAAGLEFGSWWHSFLGNVLGTAGRMEGWSLEELGETPYQPGSYIWRIGYDPAHWEQTGDPMVRQTLLRHGNFDYLTGAVQWDRALPRDALPPSLYLPARPPFFAAGKGYVWPWVEPALTARLYRLPARARYDAGTPFVQP